MNTTSRIQVTIEKMAIGGAGIARHDGLVIFVPQAAPQDELIVEIINKKKNFAEARIQQIISPGPSRRTPPCKVAHDCGGCNWQHLSEEEQRKQKHQLVLETLRKFNPKLEFEYLPIVESPRSFRYRNRIQPKYKNPNFGFFARNSHEIVNIEDCLISEEMLVEKFPAVKKWAAELKSQELQRLEMYISEENEVRYGLITDEDDGVGFSQVNRFQNLDLLNTALDWAKGEHSQSGPIKYKHILDLYAGSGNFSFHFLNSFESTPITAVELNPKLVERGRLKSKDKRMKYVLSDVESYLKRATICDEDLVILDPPRAGASEYIMRSIAAARPRKIIYISCHPVSLARDLNWFFSWADKLGHHYKLRKVQAFEMFPQTDHVETIAELSVD